MDKPLAVDLFCGLGGWSEALIDAGYYVVGFDIEAHEYGDQRYPGKLVIQDVRTIHGSQFKDATLIVASPPCQEFSYMAMPWSKAKAKRAAILADTTGAARAKLTELFDACFRIQREACEAASHHIPLIVENVRGANEWVGRSRWAFGSFHLWGDVPALMPPTFKGAKVPGFRFDGSGGSFQTASVEESGVKARGMNWSDQSKRGQDFTRIAGQQRRESEAAGEATIGPSHDGLNSASPRNVAGRSDGRKGVPRRTADHWTNPAEHEGTKNGNDWFGAGENCSAQRRAGSGSKARKAASAMIAKIPYPLAKHIAETFRPLRDEAA